jgi:hypothetical protein
VTVPGWAWGAFAARQPRPAAAQPRGAGADLDPAHHRPAERSAVHHPRGRPLACYPAAAGADRGRDRRPGLRRRLHTGGARGHHRPFRRLHVQRVRAAGHARSTSCSPGRPCGSGTCGRAWPSSWPPSPSSCCSTASTSRQPGPHPPSSRPSWPIRRSVAALTGRPRAAWLRMIAGEHACTPAGDRSLSETLPGCGAQVAAHGPHSRGGEPLGCRPAASDRSSCSLGGFHKLAHAGAGAGPEGRDAFTVPGRHNIVITGDPANAARGNPRVAGGECGREDLSADPRGRSRGRG